LRLLAPSAKIPNCSIADKAAFKTHEIAVRL